MTRHARTRGGELRRWLGERATAEYLYGFTMTAGNLAALPHPDELGIWAEDGTDIAFLLEYDTGTAHLPQLTGKLERYAHLAAETRTPRRCGCPCCSASPPHAGNNQPAAHWPPACTQTTCR